MKTLKKVVWKTLQLFATQTTLLNTTGNDLSAENKTYYEKRLITTAQAELIHDQFGLKRPIPKGGGKTIEFRKFSPLAKATTALTEGVTPTGKSLNVSSITSTVSQYGDYVEISDILDLTAIDPIVNETTIMIGSQAGRTLDTVVRDILVAGTNVFYAPKTVSGVVTAVTSRAGLDSTSKITSSVLFKAHAFLKAQNAKPFEDGCYVAIIHPYAALDIMKDSLFQDVAKYQDKDKIYKGEIGSMCGFRFIENSEAKIFNDSTTATDTAVYSTLLIGQNAYGVTEVEGGGLQHIVNPPGYGNDPLKQRSSVGWKATRTAERLVENYLVRLESCSADYTNQAAN